MAEHNFCEIALEQNSKLIDAVKKRNFAEIFSLLSTVNLNFKDAQGRTALYYACQLGLKDVVAKLISTGADTTDFRDKSPHQIANQAATTWLFQAARNGQLSNVKYYVKQGANIYRTNKEGQNPLWIAAYHGHGDIIKVLLQTLGWRRYFIFPVFVEKAANDGRRPLHAALDMQHFNAAELLLKLGWANVDSMRPEGVTSLCREVDTPSRVNIDQVKFLVHNGANVNQRNKEQSLLWIAAYHGHVDVIKILLMAGAKIDETNEDGSRSTPLDVAFAMRHWEAMIVLVQCGAATANVNEYDKDGMTKLHIAAKMDHLEAMKILILNGAYVDIHDNDGERPLHFAIRMNHVEAMKILIQNGAYVDIKFILLERTPLHIAAKLDHVEAMQVLIQNGADVDKQDNYGETPLYIAAEMNHVEAMQILIRNGAEYDKLYLAALTEDYKAVERLLESGTTGNM